MSNPMTEDEHRALGDTLRRQQDQAAKLEVDLANRYGKTGVLARRAAGYSSALSELRSALDEQVFADLKGTPTDALPNADPRSLVNIYYGQAGRDA